MGGQIAEAYRQFGEMLSERGVRFARAFEAKTAHCQAMTQLLLHGYGTSMMPIVVKQLGNLDATITSFGGNWRIRNLPSCIPSLVAETPAQPLLIVFPGVGLTVLEQLSEGDVFQDILFSLNRPLVTVFEDGELVSVDLSHYSVTTELASLR
ncbi:MAG: hypothetical protein Q7S47_01865 [bacterium]|nr:hypothetical protein [bacterium]